MAICYGAPGFKRYDCCVDVGNDTGQSIGQNLSLFETLSYLFESLLGDTPTDKDIVVSDALRKLKIGLSPTDQSAPEYRE